MTVYFPSYKKKYGYCLFYQEKQNRVKNIDVFWIKNLYKEDYLKKSYLLIKKIKHKFSKDIKNEKISNKQKISISKTKSSNWDF